MKVKQEIKKERQGEGTSHERDVFTHPAFATCAIVRTSGQARLFNSEFRHQHYITLKINRAEQHRHLSRNWIHSGMTEIEVSFSEAQFATMITSMGVGEGTPCTLERMAGESVPAIVGGESSKQQHVNEMTEHMAEVHNRIAELESIVEEAKMTNKLRALLVSAISSIATAAGANLKFVADSFTSHMEQVTEEAKIEITGYAQKVDSTLKKPLKLLEVDDEDDELW